MDDLAKALAALADLQKKFDNAQTELDKHRNDAKAQAEGKVAALETALVKAEAERDAKAVEVKRLQDAANAGPTFDQRFAAKSAVVDGARILHGKFDAVDATKPEREIMVAAL